MLRLTTTAYQALIAHARLVPDQEVCGLVWAAGDWPGDGERQIVHPVPNVHPEPQRYYRTAPRDIREAYDSMDQAGGEPVAWYHSHPGGKSDPSEEDMAGALTPGMYHLIAYPEVNDLMADGNVIGTTTNWLVSAWECVSMGVLVSAQMEVLP